MKRMTLLKIALFFTMCAPLALYAQIVVVSTSHFDLNSDSSPEEWLESETAYHENVIMKNELIKNSTVLYHLYTEDNTEVIFATRYDSWEDVEKADEKNNELAKAAWPDEAERKAFFRKQASFYTTMHSDEIYSVLPNGKAFSAKPDSSMVYYVQKRRIARMPEDGTRDEAASLMKEFTENVIQKNEAIQAYYPMRHMYGADSRDYVEVFVLNSMADMEEMNANNNELIKSHWPDEDARKAFFEKLGKYFESWHGDVIYSSEPTLMK